MPTLYIADGFRVKPKLSIVELVLYNMAAMLAGVAAGYDVRLSNISPLHPRLQPNRPDNSSTEVQPWRPPIPESTPPSEYEFSSSSGYAHNTYHGPSRHYRPLLNSLTGSPLVGLQHGSEETRPLRFTDSPQHHPNLGVVGSVCPSNLITGPTPSPRRKSSSTSNDGSDQLYAPYDRAGIYIPGEYHEAPCTGCYRIEPAPPYTSYPSEYSFGYSGGSTEYAYDNHSSLSSGSRTPQRIAHLTHRRTPSNVSNASSTTTSGSTVHPGFRLEEETYYHRGFEHPVFTRQDSHDSGCERPSTLETTGVTKLRSSLKRNNNYGQNSGGNTPTNPTPPDSLTSDDSSYVSAKDSNSSMSRVRFSPETLLDIPVSGQNHDTTIPLPLQIRRTRQRPPLSPELEREFLS